MAHKTNRREKFLELKSKEIVWAINTIGVTPNLTIEDLEKPTPEIALRCFQALAEQAYGQDVTHIRSMCVQEYAEVFDEPLDQLIVLSLTRRILKINEIDDFSFKDLWNPDAKKMRSLMSAMINFVRYRGRTEQAVQEMKQETMECEDKYREQVEHLDELAELLREAQDKHTSELQDKWLADREAKSAKLDIERVRGQHQDSQRVVDLANTQLEDGRQQLAERETQAEGLRAQVAALQDQVAESPESVQMESSELEEAIDTQKRLVKEKATEKKQKKEKVQVLTKLQSALTVYDADVKRFAKIAETSDKASRRREAACQELSDLQRNLDVARERKSEYDQSVQHLDRENSNLEETHRCRLEELETRRRRALHKRVELQDRLSEEQRKAHLLHTERLDLEAAIQNLVAKHEAVMEDLQSQQWSLREDEEAYTTYVDGLLSQSEAEGGPCALAMSPAPAKSLFRDRRSVPRPSF